MQSPPGASAVNRGNPVSRYQKRSVDPGLPGPDSRRLQPHLPREARTSPGRLPCCGSVCAATSGWSRAPGSLEGIPESQINHRRNDPAFSANRHQPRRGGSRLFTTTLTQSFAGIPFVHARFPQQYHPRLITTVKSRITKKYSFDGFGLMYIWLVRIAARF